MSGAALALGFVLMASLGRDDGGQQASLLPEPLPPIVALAAVNAPAPEPPIARILDPCSLLTAAEVAAVQGEPVRETRAHRQANAGMVRWSCFYTLPTFSRSVSLEVTVADETASGAETAREFWEQRFRSEGAESEDDHEAVPPLALDGIGERAFWVGSQLTGALYALQGDAIVRVSIGGADAAAQRIERATTLARQALQRAPSPARRSPHHRR